MINKIVNKKGQSLFEVVFVIAITAIILTGVVALTSTTVRNTKTSSNSGESARYARETVDWTRQERDKLGWTDFSAKSSTTGLTYCLDDLTWTAGACTTEVIPGTGLKREVTLTTDSADPNKIYARTVVSWTDAQGLHEQTMSTTLVDWNQLENLTGPIVAPPPPPPPPPDSVECAADLGGACCSAGQCTGTFISGAEDCTTDCYSACNTKPVGSFSVVTWSTTQPKVIPAAFNFTGNFIDSDNFKSYSIDWKDGSFIENAIGTWYSPWTLNTSHTFTSCSPTHPCYSYTLGGAYVCKCRPSITVTDANITLPCTSAVINSLNTADFASCGVGGTCDPASPNCCSGYSCEYVTDPYGAKSYSCVNCGDLSCIDDSNCCGGDHCISGICRSCSFVGESCTVDSDCCPGSGSCSGGYCQLITPPGTVVLNSATLDSCDDVCDALGYSCDDVGIDLGGTNNQYYSNATCIPSIGASCTTVMSVSSPVSNCGSIQNRWTRCKCI